MDEIIAKAHSFAEKYKKWFTDKVKELGLPLWTSLDRNLRWINHSVHLSLEIFDLIKQSKKENNLKILDLGSGKGFISFLLAYVFRNGEIYCVDKDPNPYLERYLLEFSPRNVHYVVYEGEKLPFRELYFDLVLLIEVIEHVKEPISILKEALRVTKKDGILVITTPPRLKFLFKRDPHFRFPFLYLLPLKLQKLVIERILKYNLIQGYNEYNTFHLFWTVHGIKKLLYKTGYNIEIISYPPHSIFTWNKIVVFKKEVT